MVNAANTLRESLPVRAEVPGVMTLKDGRHLAWEEYGDDRAYPLVYFHSHGSSRIEASLLHQQAKESGFRIIAVDRPGLGRSDPHPGMSLEDFAEDVLQLMVCLKLERYGILALAGGAPFALSLARSHPENISILVLLAPVPLQAACRSLLFRLRQCVIRHTLISLLWIRCHFSRFTAETYLARFSDTLCRADQSLLSQPDIIAFLLHDQREAFRQGCRGVASDTSLSLDSAHLQPENIKIPVHIWHGSLDQVVSVHCSEMLAEKLPDCFLRRLGRQGHFFWISEAGQIFAQTRSHLLRQAAGEPINWRRGGSNSAQVISRKSDLPTAVACIA
ncbi:MAG: alpha/beta hydrolase [Pseudomonadales bacterium]|nr:alpha/beta hydrolase [Pseudomonadales bacterium]